MLCSTSCMFCANPKELFINHAYYHGTCLDHSKVPNPFYKCIHCNSAAPILAQTCSECLNSNIFSVTHATKPTCPACHNNKKTLYKCDYCSVTEKFLTVLNCSHKVCAKCFSDNFNQCPVCDGIGITNLCFSCNKSEGLKIIPECKHVVCDVCYKSNQSKCPSCYRHVDDKKSKLKMNTVDYKVVPQKIDTLDTRVTPQNIDATDDGKLVCRQCGRSDGGVHCKHQICQRCLGLGWICSSCVRERKNEDKKEDRVIEIENSEIEKNYLNGEEDFREEGACKFWGLVFLLVVFYLATLCFCFSCCCNCLSGFKGDSKLSGDIYLFCLCKSKSLSNKIWRHIIIWNCPNREAPKIQ